MKIITVDPNSCVACRNCEYACSFKQTGDFDRKDSNIKVNFYPKEIACIPWTCAHCAEPYCMEICPADAIHRNEETGAIEVDPQRCAGCKMCLLACPSGNIHFNSERHIAMKCDLCGGDPNCVTFCISGALDFVEEEEAYAYRREAFDAKIIQLLAAERRKYE